jgi:hypothetical protein
MVAASAAALVVVAVVVYLLHGAWVVLAAAPQVPSWRFARGGGGGSGSCIFAIRVLGKQALQQLRS